MYIIKLKNYAEIDILVTIDFTNLKKGEEKN